MTLQMVAVARAIIALAQGFALYLLYQAFDAKTWPATDPLLFSPLLLTTIFVPLIVVEGLSNLRMRTLVIWTIAAAALCAGLGAYDVYRDATGLASDVRLVAKPPLWLALAAGLFITHSLIAAGEAERRLMASYPRHFDVSWKQGVQAVLALLFTGAFWGLLWLGSELFKLIRLDFLAELIKHRWFWIPVTALAVTSGLHVTDAHAGLVRGTRTLKLTLLSWLLPMMTLFAVVFVLALPFTGLDPLWSTRRATFILLSSAGALVFLINAAYQDGQPDALVAAALRYSRLVAAIVLVPLVALAGYGLMLRIQQYGWTPQRITALACFVVLACYAVGYAIAAALSGATLRGLQITNVATAYVILAVLLALFGPLADPARISVADQVNRLRTGQTEPDKFDYKFLRFDSGRYGMAALRELVDKAKGPQADVISERASWALGLQHRFQALAAPFRPSAQNRSANITVIHPAGSTLPESFLQQDWSPSTPRAFLLPRCLTADAKCEAFLVDLDGDGQPEILLFGTPGPGTAFKQTDNGAAWISLGTIQNSSCSGAREALRAGRFEAVQPAFKEIEVAGSRLRIAIECGSPLPR